MKQKTNEKGITLIALVITIIVMLILVAVTVTIAMDGGLFSKGETAGKETTIEAEKETLTNVVLGEYDGVKGGIDLDNLENSLINGNTKNKWTNVKKDIDNNIITLQGTQSGEWYVIYGSGTVEKIENATENEGKLTALIRLNGTTKTITLIGNEDKTTPIEFKTLYSNWNENLTNNEILSINNKLVELGKINEGEEITIKDNSNIYMGDPTTGKKIEEGSSGFSRKDWICFIFFEDGNVYQFGKSTEYGIEFNSYIIEGIKYDSNGAYIEFNEELASEFEMSLEELKEMIPYGWRWDFKDNEIIYFEACK